jgi:hypothetical protein
MCWNETVSWITFVIGTLINTLCSFTATTQLTKLWYMFFQLIIMVQLGEALIWRGYKKIGTYIAFLAVWLQPIFLGYMVYTHLPNYTNIVLALLTLYIISSISTLNSLSNNTYTPIVCGECADSGTHIDFTIWGTNTTMGVLYMICCLLFVSFLFPSSPYVCGFLVATLLISQIYYKRVFASLWCWFAVFTPLICVLTLR